MLPDGLAANYEATFGFPFVPGMYCNSGPHKRNVIYKFNYILDGFELDIYVTMPMIPTDTQCLRYNCLLFITFMSNILYA